MKYYISDLHFGSEKALKIDKLCHIGTQERNKMIAERWNRAVRATDEVYILGDVMCSTDDASAIEILKSLNGKKHLILGNHDVSNSTEFLSCFEAVDKYKSIIDDGRKVFLCHYPVLFYPGQHKDGYMIYGHVHTTQDYDLILKWRKEIAEIGMNDKIFNVGCMVGYMDFTPRTLDELTDFHKARKGVQDG